MAANINDIKEDDEYCANSNNQVDSTPVVKTIHEKSTNGDVIMALFPEIKRIMANDGEMFLIEGEDWWDAPYKKAGKADGTETD